MEGGGRGLDASVLREHIKAYLSMGLSVVPLRYMGKEPLVAWREYQERRPTEGEVEEWLGRFKRFNVAIVTGSVSGNLVVIDFDSRDKARGFIEGIAGLGDELLRFTLANTWWVETGKGVHVYLRVDVEPGEFRELFRTRPRLVEGVDVKAEGGYVVAPPSIHPSGRQYRFARGPPGHEIQSVSAEEWGRVLGLLGRAGGRPGAGGGRELGDGEALEIVNLVREAYRPGQRDLVIFFLTGWLRKAGVSYGSARRVVELLAEGDEERDKRIYVLDRTYGLRGSPPSPGELKGKSGLQEVLEGSLGEERALEVIRRLEEMLGSSSPYRDSVIELVDYERQVYAIANLRSLVVARARRTGEGLSYKEKVIAAAPTRVTVYRSPLGGVTKYEVVFEGRTLPGPLRVGPATVRDIADRLRVEGLVYHGRLVEDVLSAVVQAYIRRGRAEVREEIESPGFYVVEGKVVSVGWEPKKVSEGELREALGLLDELAEKWFGHVKERFSTIVKWGLVAPFSYCYKQRGRWLPWLYLHGASYTGKTTLAEIILHMWGLGPGHRKSGSSIDTVPRLGHVLGASTFPVLVNEPGSALQREDVAEVMKAAVEGPVARGRFVRGAYTEIPALAPLVMTSNRGVPRDDALLRRMIVLRFTYGERIDPARAGEFEAEVKPRLPALRAIGLWAAGRVASEPGLLERDWRGLAGELLAGMYRAAGMEAPGWAELDYEPEEDVYEDIREAIRSYLARRVNEEYSRFVGRVVVELGGEGVEHYSRSELGFEERVKVVIEKRLLPWAVPRGEEVLFTADLARELRGVVGDIGGLKGIAELLGWEYGVYKVGGRVVRAAKTGLGRLTEFLRVA